jgi:hypothetical protein
MSFCVEYVEIQLKAPEGHLSIELQNLMNQMIDEFIDLLKFKKFTWHT